MPLIDAFYQPCECGAPGFQVPHSDGVPFPVRICGKVPPATRDEPWPTPCSKVRKLDHERTGGTMFVGPS